MTPEHLPDTAQMYLHALCTAISNRRVGSEGNRAATDFFRRTAAAFGFEIESTEFACIDWQDGPAELKVGDESFNVSASPYSLGCDVAAPLRAIATVAELDAAEVSDTVVLLHGDIAREQVMPKNFTFYNPDEHQRIIRLLEAKRPKALVCATSRDANMVGNLYPFPLFEDGDFDIPSVFMKDIDGERLKAHQGECVRLNSQAVRLPSSGFNVIARKQGTEDRRIVLFAHIDAKMTTPGATDNASGVTVLLLLAELLREYAGGPGIELVALNGEDYYACPGQMLFLNANAGRFDDIALGINVDVAGYYRGKDAFSLYECPPELARTIRQGFDGYDTLTEGEPWYQSDHGIFLMHKRPTVAVTSDCLTELLRTIHHTPDDRPDIVDCGKIAALACALRDVITRITLE